MPQLSPRFGLVLLLWTAIAASAALAQTDDTARQTLNLMIDTAEKICNTGVPAAQASGATQPDVLPQLEDLSRKLGDAGVSGTGNLTSEEYAGVLRQQLAASANNNVQCKIEVLRTLASSLSQKTAPQRTFSVTRESGWRGGGYSPNAWCTDLISILKGEHPQGQFKIIASGEQHESRCSPFNCPQYNYSCTVQVTAPGGN